MPEKWITLKEATAVTGHKDTSTLRRAVERGQLRAERLGERVWMTKESWVRAWDAAHAKHNDRGWERGKERKKASKNE